MDEKDKESINGICAGLFFVAGFGAMVATATVCPAVSGVLAYGLPKATEVIKEKGFKGLFE